MYKTIFLTLFAFCLCSLEQGQAQCRDSQDWTAAWTSCETRPSPNSNRGSHHWLMYDLGYQYPLSSLHIWNSNMPNELDQGVKRVVLDYSEDGQNWTEWGIFDVEQANGKTYYSGIRAANFGMIQARYVLLTVLENWGDPSCVSMHELSFSLTDYPIPQTETIWLYPNPAREFVTLAFENEIAETYQLRMFNLMGQAVYEHSFFAEIGRHEVRTDLSRIAPGVYFLRLLDREGEILSVKKLVVR